MSDTKTREPGLECERCGCTLSRVVKTTRAFGYIRRRRVCEFCGLGFYTTEKGVGLTYRNLKGGEGAESG